ncbi:hypothetical protein OAD03_00780 [Candidatus Pelagibacter sp.]|jgi:hypothetical protein|nr:hypothetical protein [Candidatus Pelagibacter sp.]|tara:strand:+ start:333 stop:632 length:300 start_codon:yes stop_codon:yes gene_type:complete
MTQIELLLSVITLLILLSAIAYIYGKQKAKKLIKYSFLTPIIILCILVIVIIIGNIFNFFSNVFSRLSWFDILAMLGVCLGALSISFDNSNKNKDKEIK